MPQAEIRNVCSHVVLSNRSNNHLGNPCELPSKMHFSDEKKQLYKTNNFFLRKLALVKKITCSLILSTQNKEEEKEKMGFSSSSHDKT